MIYEKQPLFVLDRLVDVHYFISQYSETPQIRTQEIWNTVKLECASKKESKFKKRVGKNNHVFKHTMFCSGFNIFYANIYK